MATVRGVEPLGFDSRGQLQVLEPGQRPPPIKIISEAEVRERARAPLIECELPTILAAPMR